MAPDGWAEATIGAVASFIGSGVTPRGGSSVYKAAGVPFLRSQNVHFGGLRLDDVAFIEEALHEEMRRSHVRPRDVLLNITGASIGRCTSVPEYFGPANVNQHVCIIRCEPDRADARFVAQFLGSPIGQNEIAVHQAGLSREALNYEQIRALHLPLPPIGEQRKIAAILSSVDDAIEATQAVIDQLQVAKKAMMSELLTRGLPGRHTRFKQTKIGEVPEEWNIASLGDLSTFVTSGSRGWAQYYSEEGPLFIRITNLERGTTRLDLSDQQHVVSPLDRRRESEPGWNQAIFSSPSRPTSGSLAWSLSPELARHT